MASGDNPIRSDERTTTHLRRVEWQRHLPRPRPLWTWSPAHYSFDKESVKQCSSKRRPAVQMLCVDVDKLLEQDRSVRILAARTL